MGGVGRPPLPRWAPWAVFGSAVLLVLALAAVTGVNLLLLIILGIIASGVVMHFWSRSVEGGRRARDRTVTLAVTSAFLIAVTPLVSVVWTVVDRRCVPRDRRHSGHHPLRDDRLGADRDHGGHLSQ